MSGARIATIAAALTLAALAIQPGARAQATAAQPQAIPPPAGGQPETMLLTIFLRHDQSKTLGEINQHLKATGYDASFPPPGVEIASWYVMMGIGQVVTLRFPPDRLREINRLVEEKAWGAFHTDFYPTYDYKPIWQSQHAQR